MWHTHGYHSRNYGYQRSKDTYYPYPKGYDSPTSFNAPLALDVNITTYSSAGALKNRRILSRVLSISVVEARELGFVEWGLPKITFHQQLLVLMDL